ncbi:MAG: hypothetical protein H6823_15605 [Planctomycetaceae bacterium]|nr:hypothetical protein [Planctomycetales bacterium]MCB9939665.1 hypothetical protein [Planctomycetaceae bacterium]
MSEGREIAFPLPLAPFEEYMLGDDHSAYPMVFFLRLRFSGRIDETSFETAYQAAVSRHSLLRAILASKGKRNLEWVESDQLPSIRWVERGNSDALPRAAPMDLTKDPGVAAIGLHGDEGTDVVLQFHHSCCDGLGAFQFVNDLLVAYALERGETSARVQLKPLATDRLGQRDRFDLTVGKLLKMIPRQLVGLLGVGQFIMRSPVPITQHAPAPIDGELPEDFPSALSFRLDASQSAELRAVATRDQVSANDLLARDLFLAIDEWRREHDRGTPDQWLRFSVPMSLRTADDRTMPAANKVSMIFLDRCGKGFVSPKHLLQSIRDEMALIKRNDLGMTFIFSLWAAKYLLRNLRKIAKPTACQATTVLTNLGSPLARTPLPRDQGCLIVGDTKLAELDILATLRPLTGVTFCVFEYAGEFNVTMNYDPRVLSARQAQDLRDTYLRFIQQSLQDGKT